METFGSASGKFDRQKIANSAILFQAQRLVRKVCERCYETIDATDEEKALFEREGISFSGKLVKGRGCPSCGGRGTKGRLAIMEMVPIEEGGDVQYAIESGATISELRKIVTAKGCKTLFQSALSRAAAHLTPMSEAAAHNPRMQLV
jgi:type IV pilus assembly protein PilB